MISDPGADWLIYHSLEKFINLRPIALVSIKTANRSCHMTAHHAGDVLVNYLDSKLMKHQMLLQNALYRPDISINLISAARLCNIGATFYGTSDRMVYTNDRTGEELHATRRPNSSNLWTVRPTTQSTCLTVSLDLMHQEMGHLHSPALQQFCNTRGNSNTICTACSLAKSQRHPFKSTLPRADQLLYRVHPDVVGPVQKITPGGKKCFLTFIDKYCRFSQV